MAKKQDVSRRDFIRGAAKVAAGVTAGAAVTQTAKADVYKRILPQTIIGANEKILTGHIGLGGMGTRNMQIVMSRDDIQPIALCDLFPNYTKRMMGLVESKYP
ncbi:MAG TPA: twin-arginine translocation signal domain-containing protein, partial [Candidatus Hydrogenedentes bacterium]|nr:twin-arginine translocation signal domain-containing protein [Candidatus Hydrogenedentota bacterium]